MLVVLSTHGRRARSPDLLDKFNAIHQKCKENASYCVQRNPQQVKMHAQIGTIATPSSAVKEVIQRNNTAGQLASRKLRPGESYHRALSKEDMENVDKITWPRKS
jgi:hypothetical protein